MNRATPTSRAFQRRQTTRRSLVPAAAVPTIVEEALSLDVQSGTVYASGIGQGDGEKGAALATRLKSVLAGGNFAMTGPNCLGNFSAASGFIGLTASMSIERKAAPIALVGQSGGVILFAARSFKSRGSAVSYAVTTGNEIGLTVANFIEYFAHASDVRAVMIFLEAIRDRDQFAQAYREAARTGTAVIAVKVGGNDEVRESARWRRSTLCAKISVSRARRRLRKTSSWPRCSVMHDFRGMRALPRSSTLAASALSCSRPLQTTESRSQS